MAKEDQQFWFWIMYCICQKQVFILFHKVRFIVSLFIFSQMLMRKYASAILDSLLVSFGITYISWIALDILLLHLLRLTKKHFRLGCKGTQPITLLVDLTGERMLSVNRKSAAARSRAQSWGILERCANNFSRWKQIDLFGQDKAGAQVAVEVRTS